ncbi:carboxylesterase family protein [Rhodococcus qingshengii]|uniref:carboxylesterase/lipase family protein n=1 Tax=Rhodococcus qingshengii TaxID=334542 RepID=UPI0028F2EF43|nr:carboxylesterase family protein [Rhodococcus qingshengii]MDT9664905.1 carboxylesterase family protein [Rhodococcus qingshengii]
MEGPPLRFISGRYLVALAAGLAAAAACTACTSSGADSLQPSSDPRPLVVSTTLGTVEGSATGTSNEFLGIPYAAAPTGDLRWQPPVPAKSWEGVREATEFGPRCAQASGNGGQSVDNEDCLNLNVFTPAAASSSVLPVMFWIHGGGFTSGSGSQHDGSALAEINNMVVVSINYRLGFLGFLDVPGMSEGGERNFGLLDQQAAMRWTQDNIAAFGGDPTRITIAGESAGGHSVCAQLASPAAAGLFHGAIIQSGGCPSHTLEEATTDGKNFATAAGCPDPESMMTCLRTKSSQELLDASTNFRGILTGPLPIAGTPELPTAPQEAVRSGQFNNVPILIGSTRDETRAWAQPFADATKNVYEGEIRKEFGQNADAVLAHYPYDSYPGTYTATYALGAVWTDSGVFYGLGGCQDRGLARQFSVHQPRTYSYRFDGENAPTDGSTEFVSGSAHATELPYLWPSEKSAQFTAEKQELSHTMMKYWGAFAANANPNVAGQAQWPETASGNIMTLQLGSGSTAITDDQFTADQHCDLWDQIDYSWLDYNPTP